MTEFYPKNKFEWQPLVQSESSLFILTLCSTASLWKQTNCHRDCASLWPVLCHYSCPVLLNCTPLTAGACEVLTDCWKQQYLRNENFAHILIFEHFFPEFFVMILDAILFENKSLYFNWRKYISKTLSPITNDCAK